MLDADLAQIYGYTTKRLNEQLSNNDILKLSIQVNQNTREIKEIKEKMVTKSDLADIIKKFIPNNQKLLLK